MEEERKLSKRKEPVEPFINITEIENILNFAKSCKSFTGEKYDSDSIEFNSILVNEIQFSLSNIQNYVLSKQLNKIELDKKADYYAKLSIHLKAAQSILKRKKNIENKKVSAFKNKRRYDNEPILMPKEPKNLQLDVFLKLVNEWTLYYRKHPRENIKDKNNTLDYLVTIATNKIYESYTKISLYRISELSNIPYKYLQNTLGEGSEPDRDLFANSNLMIEADNHIKANNLKVENKDFSEQIKIIRQEEEEVWRKKRS